MIDLILQAVNGSGAYRGALYFFGFYPVFMALVWMLMATIYWFRNERKPQAWRRITGELDESFEPMVSMVIPAYAEEDGIADTVRAALAVDYPNFELIVVNDGSPDRTAQVVRDLQDEDATGALRLVDKEQNEGKAMAINDALPASRG